LQKVDGVTEEKHLRNKRSSWSGRLSCEARGIIIYEPLDCRYSFNSAAFDLPPPDGVGMIGVADIFEEVDGALETGVGTA